MNSTTNKRVIVLSYVLAITGYMTLTLTMPLLHAINTDANINMSYLLYCVSLLFFCFSLSAIFLSRCADLYSPASTLKYAQIISILGLVTVALASSKTVFALGFVLMGCGTGCYSPIARMLIAATAEDEFQLRRYFSFFSISVITAPFLSSEIAVLANNSNWRIGFWLMASLETALFLWVLHTLNHKQKYNNKKSKSFFSGYIACLKQPLFTLSIVYVGLCGMLVVKVILSNAHHLFISEMGFDTATYTILALLLTLSYIGGVLSLRLMPRRVSFDLLRILLCIVLFTLAIIMYFIHNKLWFIVTLAVFCYSLGFFAPITSASGFSVIHHNRAAAAALYTFSFALFSALLSILYANTMLSTSSTMSLTLIMVSGVFLLLLPIYWKIIKKS
jgi:MFS transporter, DHA1 family, 2-module integral membrane pump EmrD